MQAGEPKMNLRRHLSRSTLVLIILLAVFGAGFTVGGEHSRAKLNGLDLSRFAQVYDILERKYVHGVDKDKAAEGAVKGLVESLGDPYSAYLPPSAKQSLNDELKGEFEGVGAELTLKDKALTVVAPIANSPAEAAGLKAKDVVLKIDDQSTENMSLNDAVSKIRGPKDTTVKLTLARPGREDIFDLSIKRSQILVKSVESKMINSVGYVAIHQFGDNTVDETTAAVKALAGQKPTAMIIDLRNNPGGYLNSVAPIAGLFIPPSVVVVEQYKNGKSDEIRSTDVPLLPNLPLYILVNDGSASASEILAGALQDYKRATLVGTTTFGKGSVQDLIDLPGNSGLRVTIAEWLTPNKRAINKVGLKPDVLVEGEKTDTSDPVLDKALQLIKERPSQ